MGVDFNAVVCHGLTAEGVCQLPERLTQRESLNRACEECAALRRGWFGRRFRLRKPRWKSTWRKFDVENVELAWSQGIACELERSRVFLHLSRSACTVWTMTRWRTFLSDGQVRDSLRRVCYELSAALAPAGQSPRAIYLPDSFARESNAGELLDQGRSYDDVLTWLREHCGPPSPEIASRDHDLGEGPSDSAGYYLDEFSEFVAGEQAYHQ